MPEVSGPANVWLRRWHQARVRLADALRSLTARSSDHGAAPGKASDDLRTAQADLERRWRYLEEAQKLSHSGTFGWNVDRGEFVWSEETRRIFALSDAATPTLDLVFERIHPDDLRRMQRLKEHVVTNALDFDIEHRLLLPGGIIKYVHAVAHAGRDSAGNLEYMGVITDVTERKCGDEERQTLARQLEESNAKLEEAQRVAHLGHWEWDLETNVIVWSDETYRIFGLTPQERPMDMATNRAMVHPDDREALYGGVDADLSAGAYPIAEFRVVRPNGEVRTVQAVTSKLWGAPPTEPNGAPLERPRKLFGTVQDVTERKRAEAEREALSRDLQEIKDRLEEAQRLVHVGYYNWNLLTGCVTWSDEIYRIYGLQPQRGPVDIAMIGDMIHPDDRGQVFRAAEEAIQRGTHTSAEHRIIRPDGEVRIVHALGNVKRDASGLAYEMFGTAQDITDRKRADEALQRSQFYLSEGERLAHIGSWAFNDSGHYWSDELYKIYGLDPKNGAPTVDEYLTLIHPQDRAAIAASIRLMMHEHRGFDQIERIIRPDGQLRYLRAVAVPVVEQGVFKGFIGTTMDVTDQELMTEDLQRERAYLAEAQGLTHAGSWATNFQTGQNHHVSDEIYRLHGFQPSQAPLSLEVFFKTVHSEDEAAVRAVIQNAIQARTDFEVPEYRICLPDGTVRFLRAIGHHDPLGDIGEYIGITMDITARKRADEERERLRRLEAELAHINRVNMMGELAAALAHEIKQPIAASITSADALLTWLAREPPDLERARAAAVRIEQDANRAAAVIDSMRSFYKTGTPAEREMVDVQAIVREIGVLLGSEADRHGIAIRIEPETESLLVLANRVHLQQVFMNLMLNAVEAMRETGGDLTIRAWSSAEGRLFVSVSDTGIGLPPDSSERMFEPFHSTKTQGTGMGLTITRSIVESYGGRVWATSNLGAGATFHFILPCEAEAHK